VALKLQLLKLDGGVYAER